MEKYGFRWQQIVRERTGRAMSITLRDKMWRRQALFSPSSVAAREAACNTVESLCQTHARKRQMLDMLTWLVSHEGSKTEFVFSWLIHWSGEFLMADWAGMLIGIC